MSVRPASRDDAHSVERVWAEVAAEGEWIGAEAPLRPDWADRFRNAVDASDSIWFVSEASGQVVGGLFAQDERGLAHVGMAILGSHRGMGLGRLLVNEGVDWARSRGCHKIALEVWPHNARARGLYVSAGFVEEGYLRRHYRRHSGVLWDVVSMALVLDTISPGRP